MWREGSVSSDDHQDSESNALVPRPGTGLAETGRRTHPVISRMSRDVLARAKAQQGLSKARFRLGKYAFREPDYRQILDWAEALGESPEWVLEQLEASRMKPETWEHWEPITFVVEDGAIRSLVLDFERLPMTLKPWRKGLLIREMGLIGWPEKTLTALNFPLLPSFTHLNCRRNDFTELDLTPVPGLTYLDCSNNQLTELDLTPVPRLITLNCRNNQLTELDLSPVPELTSLDCIGSALTELDLTPVPGLTRLDCSSNQLTELDLTPVPGPGRSHQALLIFEDLHVDDFR
jgi:hypothetical protein